MPNPQNLIPVKKGEIHNPNGRGKNVPNRSTVAKYVLSMNAIPPAMILKKLKAMYPKFFEKKGQRWTNEMLMSIRISQKAIIGGDVNAYKAIMDSAHGMSQGALDITIGGKPFQPTREEKIIALKALKDD